MVDADRVLSPPPFAASVNHPVAALTESRFINPAFREMKGDGGDQQRRNESPTTPG